MLVSIIGSALLVSGGLVSGYETGQPYDTHTTLSSTSTPSCRFAKQYQCSDFLEKDLVQEYLHNVAYWEGKFAKPGIGYDEQSGYTYDGHPLNYQTGELYGEPHLFSAPSKESIHVGILALAINGNEHALTFVGGMDEALKVLQVKIDGYSQFNASYPGFGCFTVSRPFSLLLCLS
jgi:hypothetical protein